MEFVIFLGAPLIQRNETVYTYVFHNVATHRISVQIVSPEIHDLGFD